MIDVVAERIVRKNPFLKEWPYYGIIDVLNPVATAQYQHSVTIPTKPGMMHDFRDLRFFQADGTEIPFWIESKTDGSTAFVWFKPYSLSLKTVYVFYGNRDAVSQSNGDKVFEFFDDFLGSSLDTTKWTASGSGDGAVAISNSECEITASSITSYKELFSVPTYGTGYAFRSRLKSDHLGGTTAHTSEFFGARNSSTAHMHVAFYCAAGGGDYDQNYRNYNGTNHYTSIVGWSAATYFIHEVARKSDRAHWTVNGASAVEDSTNFSTSVMSAYAGVARDSTGTPVAKTTLDWVLVRKYTATEPTCQLNQSGLRNPTYR